MKKLINGLVILIFICALSCTIYGDCQTKNHVDDRLITKGYEFVPIDFIYQNKLFSFNHESKDTLIYNDIDTLYIPITYNKNLPKKLIIHIEFYRKDPLIVNITESRTIPSLYAGQIYSNNSIDIKDANYITRIDLVDEPFNLLRLSLLQKNATKSDTSIYKITVMAQRRIGE